jgi:hypothetical protein
MDAIYQDGKMIMSIEIDLERVTFLALHEEAIGGYMPLERTQFRISSYEYCSYELFGLKVFPVPPPVVDIPTVKDPATGIVSIPNNVALMGTTMHKAIQRLVIAKLAKLGYPVTAQAERVINETFQIDGFALNIIGHVDIDFPSTLIIGDEEIIDIKTCKTDTFEKVLGIRAMIPNSYAAKKLELSIGQVNAYAILSRKLTRPFKIMWMDQESQPWRFKIIPYPVDMERFSQGLVKFTNIIRAVDKYLAGDASARPRFCGIALCDYCPYCFQQCPGESAIAGGQTTLDKFMKV